MVPPVVKTQRILPPKGKQMGTLREIKDLGVQPTTYGPKHQVRFCWDLDVLQENGQPFQVDEFPFALSLAKKANLAARILSLTLERPDPKKGYDLGSLEGMRAILTITHDKSESDGFVYANIAHAEAEPTEAEKASEARVQRYMDAARKPKVNGSAAPVVEAEVEAVSPITDADVPF
jgi:hypothetical protein